MPIVRLVDPYMTDAMSEYVVLQVLRLHRQDLDYRAQQETGIWRELDQKNAAERAVGILGFGELGQDAATQAQGVGFRCRAVGTPPKTAEGLRGYAGATGLSALLGRSEILVCLLPLTPETEGILNARTFGMLPKGAALINAARGAIWSKRIFSQRSLPAISRPPCSTSSVTSRCPVIIPSGTTRASS